MPCEQCGEREAVVHLTQIADNQVTVVHLCERCASERGFETGSAATKTPLGGFLATLSGLTELEIPDQGCCPACGATLADFKGSGRLGCASCYGTFAAPLRELMRRLHGATVHRGERYHASGKEVAPEPPVSEAELQKQLRAAIAGEDFELAARLRDQLRSARA
ncbi:MAG: UvrB/UvrC motif-containing protein [Gemmatimonadales bacterium]